MLFVTVSRVVFFCLSLLLVSTAKAADETHLKLHPFQATYELDWEGGISLSGKATRTLSQQQGAWLFESKASASFASIKESSELTIRNNVIHPIAYKFRRSVLGKKRVADVGFNWDTNQITNVVENKPWKMPAIAGTQDKLSYQLLLQTDIAKGIKSLNYQVADGGIVKTYSFKVEGQETVNAPLGTFEAIKVSRVREEGSDRQTYIWFAPELDYQIVKLQQVEKKGKQYTLILKSLAQ